MIYMDSQRKDNTRVTVLWKLSTTISAVFNFQALDFVRRLFAFPLLVLVLVTNFGCGDNTTSRRIQKS